MIVVVLSSISNAGGVGLYVNNNIVFNKGEDLSCSENEHESLWIEIQKNYQHNIICGVVYRHPTADINAALTYLFNTIKKIRSENKYCILMGDFNINLLNFETHTDMLMLLLTLWDPYVFIQKFYNLQGLQIIIHQLLSIIFYLFPWNILLFVVIYYLIFSGDASVV